MEPALTTAYIPGVFADDLESYMSAMTTGVKDAPQLAFGERVIEDTTLLIAIEDQLELKARYAGSQKVLKGLVEGNPDLRGEFRVGRFKVRVASRLSITITIPKAKKVKEPRPARAKKDPPAPAPVDAETVPMFVDGQDAAPVRRQRGRPKKNGNTPEEPQEPSAAEAWLRGVERQRWAAQPHPFDLHESDNQCARCGLGEEDGVHAQSDAVERLIEESRLTPATGI